MRSLDYRSGSVRLNDFEKQNHSLTDLTPGFNRLTLKIRWSFVWIFFWFNKLILSKSFGVFHPYFYQNYWLVETVQFPSGTILGAFLLHSSPDGYIIFSCSPALQDFASLTFRTGLLLFAHSGLYWENALNGQNTKSQSTVTKRNDALSRIN